MKNRLRNKRVLWILSVCMICLFWAGTAAAESPTEPVVQLVRAAGTVDVIRTSGRTLLRYANMGLHNGDRIHTGEDGSAWIGSKGGEQLLLDAGGCLEVRTASSTPEFLLDAGSLYFHMEEQGNGSLRIRTATMALYAQNASGWVKVLNKDQVCVYLLEGNVQCVASNPVTGQVKQAALDGGRLAECTVRSKDQDSSGCEITIRDFSEEEIEGFVLEELMEDTDLCGRLQKMSGMESLGNEEKAGKRLADARAGLSMYMEKVRRECQSYAELRDPVWSGEEYSSYAMEDPELTDIQEDEQTVQEEDSLQSGQLSGAEEVSVTGQQAPQVGSVPAASQSVPSSPKKKGGSGSSAPDEKKPAYTPAPKPADPTENQGLVVEGIAQNGPQGVIEIQESGRIFVESGELFRNEGILVSSGTIDGRISNEGGEFRLAGGTVTGIVQKNGTASLEGGTVSGSCSVEGGTFRMSDGRLTGIVQKEGTVHMAGGTVTDGYTVEGGELRISGGTVAYMRQNGGTLHLSGGTVSRMTQNDGISDVSGGVISTGCQIGGGELRVSGGTVSGSCSVEGGTFRMSDGKLTSIAQKEGTVHMDGGTVTDGCTIEGGRMELSGGLLRAGSAEAALTVKAGTAVRSAGNEVTAETADVYITGGSLIGDGEDRYAIYAESGTAMVADAAKTLIRAQDAFRTIAGAQDGSWAVRYVEAGGGDYVMGADSFDNPDGSSVIYVTRKDTDGLMRLRRLSDDFMDVSRAEAGDTLTLCGDVTYQTAPAVLDVTGGSAEAPVVLDLNGRKLNLMDEDMQGGSRVQIKEDAVWEICRGQLWAWSVVGQDSGVAGISGTTVKTAELLSAEGTSTLTVRDSVIREGLAARGSGTLQITDSEIDGRIETAQNGRLEITDCRITAPAGDPNHTCIENTDSGTLLISGTEAKPGEIQNTGSAVLTLFNTSKVTVAGGVYNTGLIQVEDAELLADGGEITNQGTMNLTGGTVARMVQKGGIFHMENGTVTDGCTVTGGRFEMTNGKLDPGSADAAIRVDCSGSGDAGQNGIEVTEENANVMIAGGTVLGTGTKKAFDVCAGRVWISDDTTVKAGSAVHTIAGDADAAPGSWGVQYAGYQMQPKKPPVLYVTKKEADGMMCLRRLEDDFEKVARAEDGDVITLSGDVTGVRETGPGELYSVVATGGTETDPVILDLNGKRLREKSEVEEGIVDIVFQDAAVWKIGNGEILPENDGMISVVENSNVSFSEFTVVSERDFPGYVIQAVNSSLTIDRSVFYGEVSMVQAWTNSSVTVTGSKFLKGASVGVGDGGAMDVSDCQLDSWDLAVFDGRLNMSGCTIVSMYGIRNEKGVLNISGSSIKITKGGIRYDEAYKDVCIYNNQGEMNFMDISMLNMPGDIQAVGGKTQIAGAESGCELTASNIKSTDVLRISDCSIENTKELTGCFDISNCVMRNICSILGRGNLTECSMENTGSIRWTGELNLSKCRMKDIKQMSLYQVPNRSGSDGVNITECMIDGIKLDGTGSDVCITNCGMVDRAEINTSYGMYLKNSGIKLEKAMSVRYLSVDGGSISCAESFLDETGYMVGVCALEVHGDAVLNPDKKGVIPIKGTGNDPSITIGGNAKVMGGSSPALSFPMHCESVEIGDHAELSSSCNEGTIVFFSNKRYDFETGVHQYRDICLKGGSVINTGQGCAVQWGDHGEHDYDSDPYGPYPDIHGDIQTEFRANIADVFVKNGQTYIPDSYQVVENGGYYYLCQIPEQTTLEVQTDDPAADAAVGASLETEENREESEEETDLTAEEGCLPNDSDSAEGEEEREDRFEPAESGEKPENGPEPTESKEKAEDTEHPSGDSDSSEDSTQPTEEERWTEDAALPSEEEEALKKEMSEDSEEPSADSETEDGKLPGQQDQETAVFSERKQEEDKSNR